MCFYLMLTAGGAQPSALDIRSRTGNIELAGMEVSMVNAMIREMILRQYISRIRDEYNYVRRSCRGVVVKIRVFFYFDWSFFQIAFISI